VLNLKRRLAETHNKTMGSAGFSLMSTKLKQSKNRFGVPCKQTTMRKKRNRCFKRKILQFFKKKKFIMQCEKRICQ
jgi:hypothetical protein